MWRMQNLYKIKDKTRHEIFLKPNNIQKALISQLQVNEPIHHLTLKYRQGGVSTFWLLWWLDDTIWHANTSTGILSHERESLGYLWKIVSLAYDRMPGRLKPPAGEYNKTTLTFPTVGSSIFISLSIRSTTLNNLHVSEWAFCEDEDVRASLGACTPDANITGESTPNGLGNDFYATYQEGKLSQGKFRVGFFPWMIQEGYEIATNGVKVIPSAEESKLQISPERILFRRDKKNKLRDMFAQEYPEDDETCFLTSGHRFFNNEKIMRLLLNVRKFKLENPPIEETPELTIWEKPNNNYIYVAGADVSEGASDYSVLKIINATSMREAMTWRGRVGLDQFYKICDQYGRYFRNALLGVEKNNHGHAILLGLYETCRYPNLYAKEIPSTSQEFDKHKNPGIYPQKYGWTTDKVTRPLMLDVLRDALEGDSLADVDNFIPPITFFSEQLLLEALSFMVLDGKPQAESGKHDDDIIASAIALQMLRRAGRALARNATTGIRLGGNLQGYS